MLDWAKLIVKMAYDRSARKRLFGLRPVVSCLVVALPHGDDPPEFLLIEPAGEPDVWIPPQEGLLVSESLEAAAIRCLRTELGVSESDIQFRRSTYLGDIIFDDDRFGERDVDYSPVRMRGKSYFGALLHLHKAAKFRENRSEIRGYKWVSVDQLCEHLETLNNEKRGVVTRAFLDLAGIRI